MVRTPTKQAEWRDRKLRLATLTLVTALAAVLFAGTVAASVNTYVTNTYLYAGNSRQGNWNAWHYHEAYFNNPNGGLPQLGTTYWRTNGTNTGWLWSNTGSIFDYRTVAYGQGMCKANTGNNYVIYVYWCETVNYNQ